MTHVDALSRCLQVAVADEHEIDFRLRLAQSGDATVETIKTKLEVAEVPHFELIDGIVPHRDERNNKRMYVPIEMEDSVTRMAHELVGHQRVDKTVEKVKKHYYILSCTGKVKKFISSCLTCLMYSSPTSINERNLYMIKKKSVPFDTIHLDHFGPLPSLQSKRRHILVVVDAFTKYVKLYPVNSTSTREVISSLEKYFGYYSRPARVITDRGTCFTSADFERFLIDRNVDHVRVATASPQANGQVERVNRVLKNILGKLTEPIQHADRANRLTDVECAMNNSVHRSTGATPSELHTK